MNSIFQGIILFLIIFQPYTIYSQAIKVYRTIQEGNCRLKENDIQPLIDKSNPFFYNHHWQKDEHKELASFGPYHFVVIEQFGCLRHHIIIDMTIGKEVAEPTNLGYYAQELFSFLNKFHYKDIQYGTYRNDLENILIEKIKKYGLGNKFEFPLLEFNLGCMLEGGDWGVSIKFEIIKYIHEQEISMPGIKEHLDDGYYQAPKFD